jgi:hypothetical protein
MPQQGKHQRRPIWSRSVSELIFAIAGGVLIAIATVAIMRYVR